jgi:Domain of unknown function (DUF1906).
MSLPGHVFTAPDGVRGFDTAATITASAAAALHKAGYRFCVRYVRRDKPHASALSPKEAKSLLNAGLGLMAVQYVESESSWKPTAGKGSRNGEIAASEAEKLELPWGVTIWCDLEGVEVGTPAQQTIDYCNRWHAAVSSAGYVPGTLCRLSRRAHSTATLSVVAIHSLLGSLQSERRQVPRGEGFANEAVAAQTGRFADRCRSRFPGRQSERRCPWWPANTARIGGMARAPVKSRERTGCDHRFTTSYVKLRVSRATRSQL